MDFENKKILLNLLLIRNFTNKDMKKYFKCFTNGHSKMMSIMFVGLDLKHFTHFVYVWNKISIRSSEIETEKY